MVEYPNMMKLYKLNPKLTDHKLRKFGFKNNHYECYIFKKAVKLWIYVDYEDMFFTYRVIDVDSGELYVPYYDREFGTNAIIPVLDKKVEEVFTEMELAKILFKKKRRVYKKNLKG